MFSSPGLLNEIGPRLFRLPSEVLKDEETALDKVTFIIECLNLYRLLLLKKEDTVLPVLMLIVANSDWSKRSQTGDANLFCMAGAIEKECGELDQGRRDGGGGLSGCGVIAYRRIRKDC